MRSEAKELRLLKFRLFLLLSGMMPQNHPYSQLIMVLSKSLQLILRKDTSLLFARHYFSRCLKPAFSAHTREH